LKNYVQADIAENWSPPSFKFTRIAGKTLDSKDVGRIVGKRGVNIRRVELLNNVCLHVVNQQTDEYMIKGWMLPGCGCIAYSRPYTKIDSKYGPSDIIQRLRVGADSKRREIEVCIGKILSVEASKTAVARRDKARHSRMCAIAHGNETCVQSEIDTKSKLAVRRAIAILRSKRRDQHLLLKLRRTDSANTDMIRTKASKAWSRNELRASRMLNDYD
jgi:hypothetical protein